MQQGLGQMFVRRKSRDDSAGQYDLTSGHGAFKKNAFSISTQLWRGVCGRGFDTGITLPVGMVHVQPAVNRQPGYRWGGSDSWFRNQNLRCLRKVHSGEPEILDSWHMGSATSANQATGIGPDVSTT